MGIGAHTGRPGHHNTSTPAQRAPTRALRPADVATATAHMASLIPNSVRELGNAGRERIFDAVAIPAVLHIAIFIHRNHAAIAASNLIGIALVDLAKHGVVHKVSIAGCGAAQICAAAGGVAVSAHDTGLLSSLPRVEELGPHKA